MTTDIQTAARALMEAAGRQRLERLRDIAQRRMLCRAKIQEANESRERLARLDAEYARVEAQTAADIAREAMQAAQGAVILYPQPPGEVIEAPLTQPQPELYRAGLPPERLRKVWAEWNVTPTDDVVTFRDGEYNFASWGNGEGPLWWPLADTKNWSKYSLRPHGATWAEVEAMADERGPYCKGSWAVGNNCKTCWRCMETKPKEAPTLLDLTKLPPGTVCEATGQIARGSHVILPGERFAFAGSPTELLARVRVFGRDESFDVPTVVYARVVEVPR